MWGSRWPQPRPLSPSPIFLEGMGGRKRKITECVLMQVEGEKVGPAKNRVGGGLIKVEGEKKEVSLFFRIYCLTCEVLPSFFSSSFSTLSCFNNNWESETSLSGWKERNRSRRHLELVCLVHAQSKSNFLFCWRQVMERNKLLLFFFFFFLGIHTVCCDCLDAGL